MTIGVPPLGLKFQILQNAPNEAIRCKRIASHPPHHWRISVLASARPHFPLYICRANHSSYRLCAKTKSRVEISSLGMAFLIFFLVYRPHISWKLSNYPRSRQTASISGEKKARIEVCTISQTLSIYVLFSIRQ